MFRLENTDRDWSEFGRTDPFYAVLTADDFRKDRLTEENLALFYQYGQTYVEQVLNTIQQHFDPGFSPTRALDFGCGVGRLTIPLARIAQSITGIDISDAMLAEARARSAQLDLANVEFLRSDDQLSALNGRYDFILSSLVFQHIPPARGDQIFRRLLSFLNVGGICSIQFLTHRPHRWVYQSYYWMRQNMPFFKVFANLIQGKPASAPFMQMNPYSLEHIFSILQAEGMKEVYCQMEEHQGFESVTVVARRLKM